MSQVRLEAASGVTVGAVHRESKSLEVRPGTEAYRLGSTMRILDVVGALALIIFVAPLICAVGLLIFLQCDGPIFFVQRRIGLGGELFPCLKFRTMVPDAERRLLKLLAQDAAARNEWLRDHKLRCDPRITRLGGFLRKTSLDELPQLFNVLRGDMSLVGPRPIVTEEVPRYGRWMRYYCAVRPGITGLWQVNGRNDVSYRRRIACDILYARRQSTRLNAAILLQTIPAVLSRSGSY